MCKHTCMHNNICVHILLYSFQCKLHYDESAAEVFIHYLRGSKISDKHCEEYIVDHLSRSNKECDSSCPLWYVCNLIQNTQGV